MKKSAHAYSASIQNKQFRTRIARKECGHFNEVGRKSMEFSNTLDRHIHICIWIYPESKILD